MIVQNDPSLSETKPPEKIYRVVSNKIGRNEVKFYRFRHEAEHDLHQGDVITEYVNNCSWVCKVTTSLVDYEEDKLQFYEKLKKEKTK